MAKIRITQVKSRIGANKQQRANLEALGLRRNGRTVEHNATPQILGMIKKVQHLVTVEEI